MFSWLLVNVALSTLALLFVTLNASAPHRLRFLVSFAAMLAWLAPWQLVPEFLPRLFALDLWQMEQQLMMNTAEYSLKPVVIMSTGLPLAENVLAFTLVQLGFVALCTSGILLFIYHLCRHYMRLSLLRQGSEDGARVLLLRGLTSPVPVNIQNEIAGAFSSGLLQPKIWIHRELSTSTQLATLLRHELTHIRQHDNWYLLFITLVEKLLWWNPLVWLLGRQARELQELSCDVLCQRASADYPLHLAELMIDNARLNPAQGGMLLSANIFYKTNLNIKRIKLLQRSYSMKPRHLVSIFVTAVGAIATVGIVTAQPEAGENQWTSIRGQRVHVSGVVGAGDVLFIARDPTQPMTEVELALRNASVSSAGTRANIKMNRNGDKTEISFTFLNTPLALILQPIANMAANDGMPTFGIASAMPGGDVVDFYLATPPNGAEPFDVPAQGVMMERVALPYTLPLPFPSKLVIEDEADKVKLVTVDAENVSIEAALEIIGAEANCNIFLEDDKIVVNSCAN